MRLIPLLCLVFSIADARAQEAPPVDPAKFEAAKVHYDKGKEHQLAGRYADAIAEYQRAFEISQAPELRFIIAQAHQLDKKPKLAIAAYEKVGFRRVGVLRRYELGSDGTYHDGLLLDLLPEDLR